MLVFLWILMVGAPAWASEEGLLAPTESTGNSSALAGLDSGNANALDEIEIEFDSTESADRSPAASARTPRAIASRVGTIEDLRKVIDTYYRAGRYYSAARLSFQFLGHAQITPALEADAYALITLCLLKTGMPQSAFYFFVRTLQNGSRPAVRRVLRQAEELALQVGIDAIRPYLIKHTARSDYDEESLGLFEYVQGKASLLQNRPKEAVNWLQHLNTENSLLSPYWYQLRGAALALSGKPEAALESYVRCDEAILGSLDQLDAGSFRVNPFWREDERKRLEDLHHRCLAGQARLLYELEQFPEADRAYDRIPKSSFVWTDILYEQAWSAYAQGNLNRTLGKLVTYKSPLLKFVFIPEVDVLRAQSFLNLCLYRDAAGVIEEFEKKYRPVAEEMKKLAETYSRNLPVLFEKAKKIYLAPLHRGSVSDQFFKRLIRNPYFDTWVKSERALGRETAAIRRFSRMLGNPPQDATKGFAAFLFQVLALRKKMNSWLGGAFVYNQLLDEQSELINQFEKISYIRIDALSKIRKTLQDPRSTQVSSGRTRGLWSTDRRDDQYFWKFNGEFWLDELGDYVFGLESRCR